MEWLNYHHLYYFWMITREGGLARAARALRVSHSTLSTQLRALEAFLGVPLFERRGKRLVLTPFGAEVAAYAAEIFRMGNELVEVARGSSDAGYPAFRVGVVGSIPRTIVARLLEPALDAQARARLHVRQGELPRLLSELSAHRLHVILSDTPASSATQGAVYAHLLGRSEIWLYGTKALAKRYRSGFPQSLKGAPLLFPGPDASLRRGMERWFADRGIRMRMIGDFDDAGLLRALGGAGRGLFPVRSALRTEVEESCGAEYVGRLDGVREHYYAISVERRVRHRGVAGLIEAARAHLREPSKAPRRSGREAKKTGNKRPPPTQRE